MKIDMSDLFGKRGKITKMIEDKQVDVAAKVTLDVDKNLKLASPVDNGDFRAAWTPTPPTKPYENGKVENNMEYAKPLWNGHSPQAPAGWGENAIQAAVKGK
jgi:hypothetical protein